MIKNLPENRDELLQLQVLCNDRDIIDAALLAHLSLKRMIQAISLMHIINNANTGNVIDGLKAFILETERMTIHFYTEYLQARKRLSN